MPTFKYILPSSEKTMWGCKFVYEDADGNKKQKKKEGFSTQKEAKEYERDFISKSKTDSDMLFDTLVEHYEDYMRIMLKPTTVQIKINTINNHILPFFSGMKVTDIDKVTIQKWQKEMLEKGLSQGYLKTVNVHLSSVFSHATDFYKLSSNPCKAIKSIGSTKRTTEIDFWTLEEYNEFISHVESTELKAAFDTLYYTGMRSGELMALTKKDINFIKKTIKINKTYKKLDGEDYVGDPKTESSNRTIMITDSLTQELKSFVLSQYGITNSDRIFDFPKSRLREEIDKVCDQYLIKRIRVHDLRHSHASLLIEHGVPIMMISKRLGHSSTSMTLDVYGHLYPSKEAELIDILEHL